MTHNYLYTSREEEIRSALTKEQCIQQIEQVHKMEYDRTEEYFDAWDQLLVCESLSESTPIDRDFKDNSENVNGSGMKNDNGGCKSKVKFELTESKKEIIVKLKLCNVDSPPFKVASYLNEFFKEWESKPGHWLYIAQQWPPRQINRTVQEIIKSHISGRVTIQNAAAYFTKLIKYRKKRKKT